VDILDGCFIGWIHGQGVLNEYFTHHIITCCTKWALSIETPVKRAVTQFLAFLNRTSLNQVTALH
jgi:hypothetical protein